MPASANDSPEYQDQPCDGPRTRSENPVTVCAAPRVNDVLVATHANNIVPFPGRECRTVRGCPHCGRQSDFRRLGRLLWAYCRTHEVRWVAAEFGQAAKVTDFSALRKNLEFLADFDEVNCAG